MDRPIRPLPHNPIRQRIFLSAFLAIASSALCLVLLEYAGVRTPPTARLSVWAESILTSIPETYGVPAVILCTLGIFAFLLCMLRFIRRSSLTPNDLLVAALDGAGGGLLLSFATDFVIPRENALFVLIFFFFPVASMLMTLFLRDARESALASAALAVGALFILGLSADFGVSAAATGLVFSFATIAVITIFYILATAFGPTRRNNA